MSKNSLQPVVELDAVDPSQLELLADFLGRGELNAFCSINTDGDWMIDESRFRSGELEAVDSIPNHFIQPVIKSATKWLLADCDVQLSYRRSDLSPGDIQRSGGWHFDGAGFEGPVRSVIISSILPTEYASSTTDLDLDVMKNSVRVDEHVDEMARRGELIVKSTESHKVYGLTENTLHRSQSNGQRVAVERTFLRLLTISGR